MHGQIKIANKFHSEILTGKWEPDTQLEELTAERAKEKYKYAENSLNKFKHLYSLLEAVNYIGSQETEELCNRILIELYAIEGKLRNLAFQDVATIGEDEELKKISSVISINSARSLHADAI